MKTLMTKFKNWLKSLDSMGWEPSFNYSMVKMAEVGNASIWARITSPEWQKSQNYIRENKCFAADGRADEPFMCLMPNVNSVYFEVMLDNNYNKRIGMSNLVEFTMGQKESIQQYVDQVLVARVANKLPKYNESLNK